MSTKIFLTYDHSGGSAKIAKQISESLDKMGLTVWLDQNEIRPGDSINKLTSEGLRNSSFVIALISPNSKKSKWVSKELDFALKSNKKVIPVLIENATPENLPEKIKDKFAVYYSNSLENNKLLFYAIDENRSFWSKLKEYLVNG